MVGKAPAVAVAVEGDPDTVFLYARKAPASAAADKTGERPRAEGMERGFNSRRPHPSLHGGQLGAAGVIGISFRLGGWIPE